MSTKHMAKAVIIAMKPLLLLLATSSKGAETPGVVVVVSFGAASDMTIRLSDVQRERCSRRIGENISLSLSLALSQIERKILSGAKYEESDPEGRRLTQMAKHKGKGWEY